MNVLLINHHLIQEGDTYGLIYALQLSKALKVDSPAYSKVYGLFYINGDDFLSVPGYREKIERRLGYFNSFGLLGNRLKVVVCFYSDEVKSLQFELASFKFNEDLTLPCVHITANKTLFKSNPRSVALALTGVENDPSKSVKGFTAALLQDIAVKKEDSKLTAGPFSRTFNSLLIELVRADQENQEEKIDGVSFAYISKSTDYIVDCIRKKSFLVVASTLRELVLSSTQEYHKANKSFLDEFMTGLVGTYVNKRQKEHYSWQAFESKDDKDDFLIILFWIRGAKQDEKAAIFDEDEGSVGKPQHHTNLSLYKYIRYMVHLLGQELQKPFLFVPIGDELKELTQDGVTYGYTKSGKAYNLINFFKHKTFDRKPMGAQMNFLLQLAMEYQVIQVGMRSGSMERLMYLGVPTIYFDRYNEVKGLVAPVGAERIKQLCGFKQGGVDKLMDYLGSCAENLGKSASEIAQSRSSGFPLFFQIENKDTGFLRYSDVPVSWVQNPTGWTRDWQTKKWVQDDSWSRVPGTRLDKTIRTLLSVLNTGSATPVSLHEYNVFKKKLTEKNYLRKNLEASKKYLFLGGLNEAESQKFCSMLWFMSIVYSRYSGLLNGSETHAQLTLASGSDQYSQKFQGLKEKQEKLIQEKRSLREAKKNSLVSKSSNPNTDDENEKDSSSKI